MTKVNKLRQIDQTKTVCEVAYNLQGRPIYAVYENKPYYVGKRLFQGEYKEVYNWLHKQVKL